VPLVVGPNAQFAQVVAEPKLSASWFPAINAKGVSMTLKAQLSRHGRLQLKTLIQSGFSFGGRGSLAAFHLADQNDVGCRTTSISNFWSSTISVRTALRVSHHRSGSKLE
jgi:hypothetical protein